MDKQSIEAMREKVEEFDKFIEDCHDPAQLLLLNEARDMFAQTLKEWQIIFEESELKQSKIKDSIFKLIRAGDLVIEIDSMTESWGDIKAIATLKLFEETIIMKTEIVYQISDEE